MDTPPIGEYDESTDVAENTGSEPVYAEMEIPFPEDSLTAELDVWGTLGGFGDTFQIHESRQGHPTLKQAQLFYESEDSELGEEGYEYRLIVDIDSFYVAGRVAITLEEETAEKMVKQYTDGIWNYVE